MTRLARRALATAAVVVAGTLGTTTAAHAAVPSCTVPVVVATQVTPHPVGLRYNFIDIASATAACVDLTLEPHTARFDFTWQYFTGSGWSTISGCPTAQESVAPGALGALAVQGVAHCNQVPASAAFEELRRVCVYLTVDGSPYSASPTCSEVLLNPTPL